MYKAENMIGRRNIFTFAYSLYNFYWATTTIKCRLLSSRPMLKTFSGEKILSQKLGPKMAVFGENGPKP